MKIEVDYYKDMLFKYVTRIKAFNELIIERYDLDDIPYNLAGKKFPKIGNILTVDNKNIPYRFHGRGCTFFEEGVEIFFNVDTTSKHQIIITEGGFHCFLTTYLKEDRHSNQLEQIMLELEKLGVFMRRKESDLFTFHVNEKWYDAMKEGIPFAGDNKNEIDWL